jgi:hypothetical protein
MGEMLNENRMESGVERKIRADAVDFEVIVESIK